MNEILFAYICAVVVIGLPASLILAFIHVDISLGLWTLVGWAAFVALAFAIFFGLGWLGAAMGVLR